MSEEIILIFQQRDLFNEKFKSSFETVDTEKTGFIEKTKLSSVLENFSDKFNIAHPPEEATNKFANDLSDENSKISYEKFEEYVWNMFH